MPCLWGKLQGQKENQTSGMGSSLAYTCLKWKIWAASAQTASAHWNCPPAPPRCSWGRGRPTHPWGTPAENMPCTNPPFHLLWPPHHCPRFSPRHCFSWGVNYQWHLLEKELHVLSELLCSCCLFWLQDHSSQSLRSLSRCYWWGINSPDWLCCAETFLQSRAC